MQIVTLGPQLPDLHKLEIDNKIQQFEFILALLFAEYFIGIQHLLHSDDLHSNDPSFNSYEQSLVKMKAFLDFLYFEFIKTIEVMQVETSFYYKLFLHVLYEIESTIYFFKDVVLSQKNEIGEFLKHEVTKNQRKFETIY